MKFSWPRFLFFLFSSATVCLAASVGPTGELTVSDARRTKLRNNTLCYWHFTVTNSSLEADTIDIFSCDFNVRAVDGADCGVASFQDSCSGNSSFTVNGGHSDKGFVVIVLVDKAQGSQAYFAFSDGALDTASNISQQTKPISPLENTRRRDLVVGRQENGNSTPSTTEWKVEDLFRGTVPKTVGMGITLYLT
ncbi:hypothetical protein F4781DRAFT_415446 [Annulohypoxylon bovei var. microspora]|nr:hypothetical protein F4781DRAFT_415446 [Annulohypoxylon bovei var. microspora]